MSNHTESSASADPDAAGVDEPSEGLAYRWVAMFVVVIGTFMVVLDTTIVNLALPSLREDFDTGLGIEWVVTVYLASVGVTQMAAGWVGDRFGRKRSFLVALVLFTIGSAACAAAPSMALLLTARVLQGIGGGLLMPVAMAMIYELFEPEERGRALGIFGIAIMAAPAVGPVLGGALVTSVGWRWLFLINVPVGLIGFPVALRLLRETGYHERRPFDGIGLVTAGASIVMLLVGLQQGGSWGWGSGRVIVLLTVGAALLAVFIANALRAEHPIADLTVFGAPVFSVSMIVLSMATVAQFARLVYIPLELGTTRDISALRIGFVMLPAAIGMASTMPLSGTLTDRIGSRPPFMVGIAVMAATYWPLAHLSPDTSLVTIGAILFVSGVGSGLSMMSPTAVAMNSVRSDQVSQATGLSSVTRQVAAAMGTAVMASIFSASAPDGDDFKGPASVTADAVDAYNGVFMVAFVVLLATFVGGWFLPGKRKAIELQQERRIEYERMGLGTTQADPVHVAEPL